MFKDYKKSYITKDIISGIIVALISIPISMGYAQVSGLPVVYGLYGSVVPILIYAFITTTKGFVFGVDAAPAALVGGALSTLGITAGSIEAAKVVPVITIVTACWLLVFYICRAGRIVKYISSPVMGGFVSGICCSIILMQIPKLFGGAAGIGEIFELMEHTWQQLPSFNMLSFVLGIVTIVLISTSKKIAPKFPMPIVLMFVGALITKIFHIDQYGVKLLPHVEGGLPKIIPLDFTAVNLSEIIVLSLTIALIIMTQTLLASGSYAQKNDYKLNNNREILAYSAGNFAAGLFGCCPVNGSVSRSGLAEQFGCKSQLMSIAAAFTMVLVLLFGTGIIEYLPVPILTGIVMTALFGACEFKMAKKLIKVSRQDFFIFVGAFAGVLVLGTIYGVVVGVVLSFVAVIIRAIAPPVSFLGVVPGQDEFFSIERTKGARPIKDVVIYRFNGNLFFANIGSFTEDIENAITNETKVVIVDAGGVGNVDITAAEQLMILYRKLKERNIEFYFTEHVGAVNDQLRTFGAGKLIAEGAVRRTVTLALRNAGINRPYPTEAPDENYYGVLETNEVLAEIEWAFGDDADKEIDVIAKEIISAIANKNFDVSDIRAAENAASWGRIGLFDEDELLDRLEMHLSELASSDNDYDEKEIEDKIERRRAIVERKLMEINPDSLKLLKERRERAAQRFKHSNPQAYRHLMDRRHEHIEKLRKIDPALAEKIAKFYKTDKEVED